MTLPTPDSSLKACVVVPARDEEDLIASCLRALGGQRGVASEEYEVLLVLDRCTDRTEERASEVAAEHPGLRLRYLDGPGEGSGAARRVGMDAACARLLGLGRPDGLIACTDADTVVAPDWLDVQLRAVAEGARAIGGRIELADDGSVPQGVRSRHALLGRLRHERLQSEPGLAGKTQHWQFSGASMALTAEAYRRVGGLEPRADLEDEHLEAVLRDNGIPIDRLLSVKVTTSPRLEGRARRGLSQDLAGIARLLHGERSDG